MYDPLGIAQYIMIIILFLFLSIIYWLIYNRYTSKIIRKERVRFRLPEKRIVITLFAVISLVFLVITSIIVVNDIKRVYNENIKYTFIGYVATGQKERINDFLYNDYPDFDINDTDALMISVRGGDLRITKYLLENGANPNKTFMVNDANVFYCYTTPIYFAAYKNNYEMVKLLLEHGANPNYQIDSISCISDATYNSIINQNLELLKLLVEYKTDIHKTTPHVGLDYLELTATTGNVEIFEYLLSKGLEIDRLDEQGVVYQAVMTGKLEFSDYLLSTYDLKINQRVLRETIYWSVYPEAFETHLNYILSKGLDYRDEYYGMKHWVEAVHAPYSVEKLEYFKNDGVNLLYKNQQNQNLIHISVIKNYDGPDIKTLEYLISQGIDPNEKDKTGKRPVDYANPRWEEGVKEYIEFFEKYK